VLSIIFIYQNFSDDERTPNGIAGNEKGLVLLGIRVPSAHNRSQIIAILLMFYS
jgi:hypothetical protein